jgi:excisionase family DNA binding protein
MTYRTAVRRRPQLRKRPPKLPAPVHGGRPVTKLRTIEETAEIFNASPRTVARLIRSGALPVHRLGRLVRIADADILVFLASNRSV